MDRTKSVGLGWEACRCELRSISQAVLRRTQVAFHMSVAISSGRISAVELGLEDRWEDEASTELDCCLVLL